MYAFPFRFWILCLSCKFIMLRNYKMVWTHLWWGSSSFLFLLWNKSIWILRLAFSLPHFSNTFKQIQLNWKTKIFFNFYFSKALFMNDVPTKKSIDRSAKDVQKLTKIDDDGSMVSYFFLKSKMNSQNFRLRTSIFP